MRICRSDREQAANRMDFISIPVPKQSYAWPAMLMLVGVFTLQVAPVSGETLNFRLPAATDDQSIVALDDSRDIRATVVCFLGVQCPLAKLYGPRLADLNQTWSRRGVRFIGIVSNRQDSRTEVARYAKEHQLGFPIAMDYGGIVANRYGAQRTPEVFVIDDQLEIRYQGRIDNQYRPGRSRASASEHYLRDALRSVVEGKPVELAYVEPVGCMIGREKAPETKTHWTYTRDIAPILNRHCVECHRDGEIAPFALTDYEEIVGWAETMVEVIDQGRMPPWHATDEHLSFSNARLMPTEDKETLRNWVQGGMPYGNVDQFTSPPQFISGWQLTRDPDDVLEMSPRAFTVPAEGTVEYQYFVVDPGFEEDRWIREAQLIPGNPAVVHHGIVFVRPPDGERFRGVGWLTAYVPGQRPYQMPAGRARLVPAGSKLVFQMHYTPTGIAQGDLSRVGLIYADSSTVTHEVFTPIAINQDFEIPPHAAAHPVRAKVEELPANGELLSVAPHMHLRGRRFKLYAQSRQGEQPLLHVPRYDFNWQHTYVLKEPLALAEIESLQFVATFDNSSANPENPDPTQTVTWGDQTWEEMAVAFFDVSVPRDAVTKKAASHLESKQALSDGQHRKAETLARQFFDRMDTNRDGVVERHETPIALRAFGFRNLDRDRDDRLGFEEVRGVALEQLQR